MSRKQTIALALAAFIFLPLFFSGGLQLFQLYLKQRVEHRLENEKLVTIRVPLQNIRWVEEEREVMVNGKMFDLKSYHEEEGVFTATGVWDEKETAVMNLISGFNDQAQTGLIIRVLLLIQSIAFVYPLAVPFPALSFFKCFLIFDRFFKTIFLKKIYHPPRNFSLH